MILWTCALIIGFALPVCGYLIFFLRREWQEWNRTLVNDPFEMLHVGHISHTPPPSYGIDSPPAYDLINPSYTFDNLILPPGPPPSPSSEAGQPLTKVTAV